MQVHQHPHSGDVIKGLRLGPTAKIRQTDRWNRPDTSWEPPQFVGVMVVGQTRTIWVRPDTDLSSDSRHLLRRLILRGELLVNSKDRWWIVSSASAKRDDRITLLIEPSGVAEELLEVGYIQPFTSDLELFVPNPEAREYTEDGIR